MKKQIDLHLHTNCSDGVQTPDELLEIVRTKNLSAFSITDHDTLRGYWRTKELLAPGDPELVPGLELSVTINDKDLHLLAYFFDPNHEPLISALDEFQQRRNHRGRLIVQKLNEMGVNISYDDIKAAAGKAAIGRPHIAETMFRLKAVRTYEEGFEKYIRNGGPAYVPKRNFTPEEVISLIHQAGGVTVLAHPVIDATHRHLEKMVAHGLDGIEVYHPVHSQRDTDWLTNLADRYRLLVSGGSDFHGREGRYGMVGSRNVPERCLIKLKERALQRRDNR